MKLIKKFFFDLEDHIYFVIGALFALLINIYLAIYDFELLGEFNKSYAFFIILSHFFIFSLHDFLVQRIPNIKKKLEIFYLNNIILFLIFLLIIQGLFFIIIKKYFSIFLNEKNIFDTINFCQITVPLFIVNKTFFGYLNAKLKMRLYFILNNLRPILILIFLIIDFKIINLFTNVAYSILATEIILTIINFLICFRLPFAINIFKSDKKKFLEIFNFCVKANLHSFLSYSFIRIDILVLSFFVNIEKLGIYSFAAMLIEGIYQLGTVIRDKINPKLSVLLKNKQFEISSFKKEVFWNFILSIGVFIFSILIFFPAFEFFKNESLYETKLIFMILYSGLFFYSTIICFENIFIMNNKPHYQSIYILLGNLLNIFLNIKLIPLYSINGAAYATALTFLLLTIILFIYVIQYSKK